MTAAAPPLLATKLQAPALRRELVARGSLINQLRDGATARMTVVTAPPGWGKTTLLAAWRLVEGDHRRFAWLSLDGGDSDPARFWSYVIEALRAASPALEQRLAPLRRRAAPPVLGPRPSRPALTGVVSAEPTRRLAWRLHVSWHSTASPRTAWRRCGPR